MGVAAICRRAGVSKGAFYYHFESKQAVLFALIDRWLQELEDALTVIADHEGDFQSRLQEMARAFQTILDDQRHRLALILELWTQASRDDDVQQAVLAPYHHFKRFFIALIQDGIDEGNIRPIDPVAGAQVVLSMASGLFFQGLLDPEGADWGAATEKSIHILLEGIGR
jgi:AcrR family transcriptional regulator